MEKKKWKCDNCAKVYVHKGSLERHKIQKHSSLTNEKVQNIQSRITELEQNFNDLQSMVKDLVQKIKACTNEKICLICWEFPTNHAFVPCGHKLTCGTCAATILTTSKRCPICREYVTDILQIWDVGKPENE